MFEKEYKNNSLKIYFNLICVSSFIFFFSINIENIQIRFLVLLLLLPSSLYFFNDLKNKNFTLLKYLITFLLFIYLHLIINLYFENDKINLDDILSILLSTFIFIIAFYYNSFIHQNIFKIIKLFLIIFLFSSLTNFYNFKQDAPYFCGGIPDLFNLIQLNNENVERSNQVRLSFKEYIFNENSHLGMIAPGVLIFLINYFLTKKTSILDRILIIFFLLICIVKSSTTLILGIITSLTAILIFNYKNIPRKVLILFLFTILLFSSIFISNKQCRDRLIPIYPKINIDLSILNFKADTEITINKVNKKNKITLDLEKLLKAEPNLSSAVYFNALSNLKTSLFEKPFGWGFNQYKKAFENYNKPLTHETLINTEGKLSIKSLDYLNYLNDKDGTNNFVKIIVEFGFFGIFIYFFVFIFLVNKNLPLELKFFYLPIVFSQSLRGAGYYNGGFILIIFLMLFTYINLYKKKK